jgi:hypothetical protein
MRLKLKLEDIFQPASPEDVAGRQQELKRREEEQAERDKQERLRREREQKEREERLKKQFAVVLRKLGYTKNIQANDWGALVSANRDQDHSISLRLDNKRVNVSGSFPRGPDNHWVTPYDDKGNEFPSPKISISPDKTVDQMVTDIRRRFLPYYEKRMEMVQKQIAKDSAHTDQTTKNMRILKGKPVSDYEAKQKTIRGYDIFPDGKYGEVKVDGDEVEIQASHLTIQQAQQIIRIIRGK